MCHFFESEKKQAVNKFLIGVKFFTKYLKILLKSMFIYDTMYSWKNGLSALIY